MTDTKCTNDAALKRVLIVDSNVPTLKRLKKAFEDEPIEVLTATNGNVGLAIALTRQPDLIVMDIMLPGRSGFLLLEFLRSHSDLACPIIVATKNDGRRHREYAEILGANNYILKPVNLARFKKASLELMGNSSADPTGIQGQNFYADCTKLAAFSPLS